MKTIHKITLPAGTTIQVLTKDNIWEQIDSQFFVCVEKHKTYFKHNISENHHNWTLFTAIKIKSKTYSNWTTFISRNKTFNTFNLTDAISQLITDIKNTLLQKDWNKLVYLLIKNYYLFKFIDANFIKQLKSSSEIINLSYLTWDDDRSIASAHCKEMLLASENIGYIKFDVSTKTYEKIQTKDLVYYANKFIVWLTLLVA